MGEYIKEALELASMEKMNLNQRVLNDVQRARLSRCRMITPPPLSPISKFDRRHTKIKKERHLAGGRGERGWGRSQSYYVKSDLL
jgi:hypothetical protein